MGSVTTQGCPAACAAAAGHVAFRSSDGVGALIANFRSSIPSPSIPLFTLHWTLHSAQRKTRGRVVRYSFLVRLFHPLSHAGSSRRTTTFFSRHGFRSWLWSRIRIVSRPTWGFFSERATSGELVPSARCNRASARKTTRTGWISPLSNWCSSFRSRAETGTRRGLRAMAYYRPKHFHVQMIYKTGSAGQRPSLSSIM